MRSNHRIYSCAEPPRIRRALGTLARGLSRIRGTHENGPIEIPSAGLRSSSNRETSDCRPETLRSPNRKTLVRRPESLSKKRKSLTLHRWGKRISPDPTQTTCSRPTRDITDGSTRAAEPQRIRHNEPRSGEGYRGYAEHMRMVPLTLSPRAREARRFGRHLCVDRKASARQIERHLCVDPKP